MQAVPAGLGRRLTLDAELRALGDPALLPARVLAQHRARWLVATPGAAPRLVTARGRLRDQPGSSPVTGDWVALDGGGAISHVLERRGHITRRAAGRGGHGQVLAANVDLALVLEPLPVPNPRRAERLAALAAAGGVPALLVVAKADLDPDAHVLAARLARRLGLADVVAVSAREGDAVARLSTLLAPGRTAVLLGSSGSGKSTLANALLGEDRQATAAVRVADGRGRHTSVVRELLALPGGALLIDTPGVREVGVWDGLGGAFSDIDALATRCRFADCRHEQEPGCAVRGAVEPERLASWRKLAREQARVDDRRTASRRREAVARAHGRRVRAGRRARPS